METKHTKGKWRLQKSDPKVFIGESYNSGTDAEFCAFVQHSVDRRKEAFANAKLIAAAPDLLDALSKIMIWVRSHPRKATIVQSVINEADAAIKKATE